VERGDGVYRVQPDPASASFSGTRTVSVPNEPGPVQTAGGPLLLVGGLAGLAGLAVLARRGGLETTERERAWLAYRAHRTEFGDWITTADLPEAAASLPAGQTETLADLVDLAIDTDSAVVEVPDGAAYHVVTDGYRYTFRPPAAPGRSSDGPSSEDEGDGGVADEQHDGEGTVAGDGTDDDATPTVSFGSSAAAGEEDADDAGAAGSGRESSDDRGAKTDGEGD
jgi:hypothetical protein